MDNRNEDSDDDEDGAPLTKHGRSNVIPKLIENTRKHMERWLSAVQRDAKLLKGGKRTDYFVELTNGLQSSTSTEAAIHMCS